MIRRDFVKTTGLFGGSLVLASIYKVSDAFGMPVEDSHLQIATAPDFLNIVLDVTGYVDPSEAQTSLTEGQTYYWRQTLFIGGVHLVIYHGRLLGQEYLDLVDLYNGDLVPFVQEVREEPVPPEPTIEICHIPPGNPQNAHQKVIPVSDLGDHLGHGDHVGECTGQEGAGDGVGKGESDIPEAFEVGLNYPNPVLTTTTIPLALPESSRVRMSVYNMLGQQVESFIDTELPAGRHQLIWNGSALTSGSYMLVIEAGPHRESRQIVLAK